MPVKEVSRYAVECDLCGKHHQEARRVHPLALLTEAVRDGWDG